MALRDRPHAATSATRGLPTYTATATRRSENIERDGNGEWRPIRNTLKERRQHGNELNANAGVHADKGRITSDNEHNPSSARPAQALESPAAERNKDAILDVLRRVLPAAGSVLEIASGTGQHVVHFARTLPTHHWQPSDPDPEMRASIRAHVAAQTLGNVAEPLDLDVCETHSPSISADAVLCSNMIHIAPWAATEGLFAGASAILSPQGPLVTYGPYKRGGEHTAPSNAAFDASLRERNPAWGVRDVDHVVGVAALHGFALAELVEMPANNLTLVFRAR